MISTGLTYADAALLLEGAWVTIAVTILSCILGTILGFLVGWLRSASGPVVNFAVGFVFDFVRSVPLLILLILANSLSFILAFRFSLFTVSCIVLGIWSAAFYAEIFRAGIDAVPKELRRSARSLGMTYLQDMWNVVLPNAIRISVPAWVGQSLAVLKDSALVMWIGIMELLRAGQIIVTRTNEPILVLVIVGLIYFILSYPLSRLGGYLEKRWQV